MKTTQSGKVGLIGGGGIRTPLLVYGVNETAEQNGLRELALFDVDRERAGIMAALGKAIVEREGGALKVTIADSLEAAVEDADFVISSIRPGGIAGRARDERLAFEHGFPGQETTGPGGFAMALRTIPVALAHAQVVERYAPDAWYISFTNPAGLITQALALHSKLKVMGICDTPIELFHAIARALRLPISDLEFEYAGLNHLGWVRKVSLRGRNITSELLENEQALLSLYPANLFPAELIRGLGVIPTEYLYFYYRRNAAYRNQAQAKATRGEEIERLNEQVLADIASALKNGDPESAISTYVNYLIRRSGSYMKLEASAGSAFGAITPQEDPFRSSTGYHRMVLEVIAALRSDQPRGVVANVRNDGALEDFADDDVVETICDISSHGVKPRRSGHLPESVRGLAISMKAFERTTVRAAVEQSASVARTALLIHPSIGDWDAAVQLQQAFAF